MSTTRKRSNVVAKVLLITALASGIAGMQAQPAFASTLSNIRIAYNSTPFLNRDGYIDVPDNYNYRPQDYISDISSIDFSKKFYISVDKNTYLYYSPNTETFNTSSSSSYNHPFTFNGGTLYRVSYCPGTWDDTENFSDSSFAVTVLGDAKSILGGSSSSGSSSGLSEEQKTIIKDLIANVDGNQTVKGDSITEGNNITNGNSTIKGDLEVEGSTNLKDTNITGKLTVNGNQEVTGDIYAHGSVVANNAGFNNLAVINGATIGNNTDFVNMKDGNVVATGSITALGNFGVAGNTVLNGDVQMNSNASVKGDLNVGGSGNFAGTLSAQDAYLGGQSVLGRFAQQDQKINKTGAAAAAMAGLHPLDFDEEQKLNFAAATGSYHGSSAIALGMFYRPNEQVMFNLSGSSSGSEHMYTLGASFALDRPSGTHVSSRRALTEKVQQLSQVNEAVIKQSMELQAKNDELQSQIAELRQIVMEMKKSA